MRPCAFEVFRSRIPVDLAYGGASVATPLRKPSPRKHVLLTGTTGYLRGLTVVLSGAIFLEASTVASQIF